MIEKYDLLHNALIAVREIDANQRTEKKFDPLKEFLVNSTEAEMTLYDMISGMSRADVKNVLLIMHTDSAIPGFFPRT